MIGGLLNNSGLVGYGAVCLWKIWDYGGNRVRILCLLFFPKLLKVECKQCDSCDQDQHWQNPKTEESATALNLGACGVGIRAADVIVVDHK